MDIYKLMEVSCGTSVWFKPTDSQELSWILAELKKFIPSYRVKSTGKIISGEAYYYGIDKGEEVGWRIMQQLCLRGWEPFAFQHFVYHLRHKG